MIYSRIEFRIRKTAFFKNFVSGGSKVRKEGGGGEPMQASYLRTTEPRISGLFSSSVFPGSVFPGFDACLTSTKMNE